MDTVSFAPTEGWKTSGGQSSIGWKEIKRVCGGESSWCHYAWLGETFVEVKDNGFDPKTLHSNIS